METVLLQVYVEIDHFSPLAGEELMETFCFSGLLTLEHLDFSPLAGEELMETS